jgi:hypothetical protein
MVVGCSDADGNAPSSGPPGNGPPGALGAPDASPGPADPRCQLHDGGTLADLKTALAAGCAEITTLAGAHVTLEGAAGTESVPIPAGVSLVFRDGAAWTLADGLTVTVTGGYTVPTVRSRVFDGAGHIVSVDGYDDLGCPNQTRTAYPEWFGAVANDGNDDSDALLRALAFGNRVELAAGTYDVRDRLPLLGHQTLTGVGKSITYLSQMPDAHVINYAQPGTPGYETWTNILLQDFIVSLTSDCTHVEHLSILGDRVPDDPSALSNVKAALGSDPLVNGIQISSHYGWTLGQPPVKNTVVSDVEVFRPLSACINIQSDRGAENVMIDGVACNARTWRQNTSGMTIEAFHPTVANIYRNVTVKNSSFTGGIWGFYIAGVTDLLIDDVTLTMEPGSAEAVLWYTGDSGHKTTGTITNSKLRYDAPSANAVALLDINARGYVKDTQGVFPYLVDVGTGLAIENTSLTSAELGATKLIPLVKDSIGITGLLKISGTTFAGGSYGILGDDEANPEAFGATVYVQNAGAATTIRDVTPEEIAQFHLKHSDYEIAQSTFEHQAMAAVRLKAASVNVHDSTFDNVGLSPNAAGLGVIDLRGLSYLNTAGNSFTDNAYSTVNNAAFVRVPSSDPYPVTFVRNSYVAFDASSKPSASVDSLVSY